MIRFCEVFDIGSEVKQLQARSAKALDTMKAGHKSCRGNAPTYCESLASSESCIPSKVPAALNARICGLTLASASAPAPASRGPLGARCSFTRARRQSHLEAFTGIQSKVAGQVVYVDGLRSMSDRIGIDRVPRLPTFFGDLKSRISDCPSKR